MSSIKCSNCDLANFATAEVCKRCGMPMSKEPAKIKIRDTPPVVPEEVILVSTPNIAPQSGPSPLLGRGVPAHPKPGTGGATVVDVLGRLIWATTFIVAAFSLLNFLSTQAAHSDISAPQMAALAAQSLTLALLPYAIARAWDEVFRPFRH